MLSSRITSVRLLSVLAIGPTLTASADVVTVQNDLIRVDVDKTSGCFTVVEKVTGQTWVPDPWDGAAAVLRVWTADHKHRILESLQVPHNRRSRHGGSLRTGDISVADSREWAGSR